MRGYLHTNAPIAIGLYISWILAYGATTASAQNYRPYQPTKPELNLPEKAVARPGNGARLLVRSPLGHQQVVELLCAFDDKLVVIRPTGELGLVSKDAAQPTEEPFGKFILKDVNHALETAGIKGYKMDWEKPYLYVYACSDEFYEYTKTIIRSMYPGVVRKLMDWGMNPTRPETPLMIVITANRRDYDALKRVPPEVVAYYDLITNHVVLYEDQAFTDAAPDLALKQAAYTIVHEGVHQLLFNTGVQQRLSNWPMWVTEGVPEYLSPLTVRSKVVRRGSDELPVRTVGWTKAGMVNDLNMFQLLQMKPDEGRVIRETIEADELDADGYAVAWGLVHHLASNRSSQFKSYLAELKTLTPLGNTSTDDEEKLRGLFVRHFGDDFAALEKDVQQHLTSESIQDEYSDPIANQTRYFMKRIQKQGKAFLVAAAITTSPAAAWKWREEQEKEFKSAKFYTIVCKTQQEAEYELRKFQSLGR